MIIGDIHHPECAGLSPVLLEAVRLAVKAQPQQCEPGRYDLQGDDIYMNVMRFATQPAESKKRSCTKNLLIFRSCWKAKKQSIMAWSIAPGSAKHGTTRRTTGYVQPLPTSSR